MFNQADDLSAIWRAIANDQTIQSLMGLAPDDDLGLADHIIQQRRWYDLAQGEKRICIYPKPSRQTSNQSVHEQVIQIDCHVPALEEYVAHQVQARVKVLLDGKPINKRDMHWAGTLGELPSMPGFVSAGTRFRMYVT